MLQFNTIHGFHVFFYMGSMCFFIRHAFCSSNDQNFDAFVQVLNETSGIEGGCIAIAVRFPGESNTIETLERKYGNMTHYDKVAPKYNFENVHQFDSTDWM